MLISCICWASVEHMFFLVDDIVHAFGKEIGLFDDVDRIIYHLKFFFKKYHVEDITCTVLTLLIWLK